MSFCVLEKLVTFVGKGIKYQSLKTEFTCDRDVMKYQRIFIKPAMVFLVALKTYSQKVQIPFETFKI